METGVNGVACNIGGRGIRHRRIIGYILIAIGVALCFRGRNTNMIGWVIAFFGFLSWFQAQSGT